MKLIGVDIGGSHISAAEIFWERGQVSFGPLVEAEVNTLGEKEEIFSSWALVIQGVRGSDQGVKIGIAMPGPYDYEQGISLIKDQGKMKALYGLSVKNMLAEKLEINPDTISFTNDAEAFLRGESMAGSGKDFSNSLGITLGTGLGSAIKIHQVVKDGMLWTAPFRDGIAEDYLGTTWFVKKVLQKTGVRISGVKDLVDSTFDPVLADKIFSDFGYALGEFLWPYVMRMHMEGVILGGRISDSMEKFLPYTVDYMEKMDCEVKFEKAKLGSSAALLGACHSFLIEASND